MKGNTEKKGFDFWLVLVLCIYPFAMVGAYYLEWNKLFYFGVVPIVILLIINIYGKFKYANWLYALLQIIYCLVFAEIGYLITHDIIDGICMGCYVGIILGIIEVAIRKMIKK